MFINDIQIELDLTDRKAITAVGADVELGDETLFVDAFFTPAEPDDDITPGQRADVDVEEVRIVRAGGEVAVEFDHDTTEWIAEVVLEAVLDSTD